MFEPERQNMIKRIVDIIAARISRSRGEPAAPKLMTWNVTNRCNSRCVMCEIHQRGTSSGEEITPSEFAKLLEDPALKALELIRITGGEPFLRRDLPELVAIIGLHTGVKIIYITTNGSFPERLKKVVETADKGGARLHVQVSLDALDATHDQLRCVEGMAEKAKETCSRIAELKKRYDFYGGINQTVMRDTLQHMESVHEYAKGLGLGHHMFLGAEFHEGKDMNGVDPLENEMTFTPEGGMNEDELKEFYRLHNMLKRDGSGTGPRRDFASSLLRDISEEYLNEGGRNRVLAGRSVPNPPCMAMFTHFRLAPNGTIYACSALNNYSVGNIKKSSFSEIWHGESAAKLRRKVLACKGCWIECDINPSIFFSGDIIPWFIRRAVADPDFRRSYFLPHLLRLP